MVYSVRLHFFHANNCDVDVSEIYDCDHFFLVRMSKISDPCYNKFAEGHHTTGSKPNIKDPGFLSNIICNNL